MWGGVNLGGRREEMKKIKQKNRGSGVAGSLARVKLGGVEYFGATTKTRGTRGKQCNPRCVRAAILSDQTSVEQIQSLTKSRSDDAILS